MAPAFPNIPLPPPPPLPNLPIPPPAPLPNLPIPPPLPLPNAPIQHQVPILPSTPSPTFHLLRPSDIPILALEDLSGIESECRISKFISNVEDCVSRDEDRVKVALNRLNASATFYVKDKVQFSSKTTWAEIKKALVPSEGKDFNKAIDELREMKYKVQDDPYEFIRLFTVRYAAVKSAYPNDQLWSRDKMIRKKLIDSVDKSLQEMLDYVSGSKVDLRVFLHKFDEVRRLELQRNLVESRVYSVNQPTQKSTPSSSGHDENQTTSKGNVSHKEQLGSSSIKSLEKQLASQNLLIEQLTKTVGKQSKKYCAFCKESTHSLMECPKKPTKGLCFDCQGKNCKRGDKNCPGKPQKSDK